VSRRLRKSADRSEAAAREVQMLVEGSPDHPYVLQIEPEGMSYDLPPGGRLLLTFVLPEHPKHYFDVAHRPDGLTIWRSNDTEVWATLSDGTHSQIAGFKDIPAPWMDAGNAAEGTQPPWTWPPAAD